MREGGIESLEIPPPSAVVMEGVRWGAFTEFGTPAYWKALLWLDEGSRRYDAQPLGKSLREEIAACMLSGYGMPSEMGLAAFERLRVRGLVEHPNRELIEAALREPLLVKGTLRKYRFPIQKARFIAAALARATKDFATDLLDDLELRNALLSFPGIGPKTASWVVRNFTASDRVAIFDVHIVRVCIRMRLFESFDPSRYLEFERRFLEFAKAIGVRASALDNAIWQQARIVPHEVLTA
jgi:N-glycosylase/DNA lyase